MIDRALFDELKKKEQQFSIDYPLEESLLGSHPYIIHSFSQQPNEITEGELKDQVLFFSPKYEDEKLNELTIKIIDSFKFQAEKLEHCTGLESSKVKEQIHETKPRLVVCFGGDHQAVGSFVKDDFFYELKTSCLYLWNASELADKPDLKKQAWTLIQKVSEWFNQ